MDHEADCDCPYCKYFNSSDEGRFSKYKTGAHDVFVYVSFADMRTVMWHLRGTITPEYVEHANVLAKKLAVVKEQLPIFAALGFTDSKFSESLSRSEETMEHILRVIAESKGAPSNVKAEGAGI